MRIGPYVFALLLALAPAAPAAAQQAAASAQPPAPGAAITPGEVQRMFDAYTLVQAQDALNLSEAQYGRFVSRFKALQDTRRRHQVARLQILGELRRALNGDKTPDEGMLRERLKALGDEDERAAADVRKALDGVDEVLDVRQQARFRVFEERMEARKLELLLKARQNARPRGRQ